MARAIVALVAAGALRGAGAVRADERLRLGASGGIAFVLPDAEAATGTGTGLYADVEVVVAPGRYLTPRLYAGVQLANADSGSCGPDVTPCEVSARFGFAGAKARLMLPIRWAAPFLDLGAGVSAGRFSTRNGPVVDLEASGVAYHLMVALGVGLGERNGWPLRVVVLEHPSMKQSGGGLVLGLELTPGGSGPAPGAHEEPPPAAPAPAAPAVAVAAEPEPVATIAAAGTAEAPAPLAEWAARRKRGRTYVGGWLGFGGGEVHGPAGNTGFVFVLVFPLPAAAGLRFGVPAGGAVLVGAEWNVNLGFNCVASMDEASGGCDRGVLLQQLLATATVFPFSPGTPERAPAGPFVRAGAGLAHLNSWAANIASTAPEGAPPPAGWKRTGWGVLGGLGYSFRGAPAVTVEWGVDLAWQWYEGSASQPKSSFSLAFPVSVTFH
jgi:hypothetical protein